MVKTEHIERKSEHLLLVTRSFALSVSFSTSADFLELCFPAPKSGACLGRGKQPKLRSSIMHWEGGEKVVAEVPGLERREERIQQCAKRCPYSYLKHIQRKTADFPLVALPFVFSLLKPVFK